MLFKMSKKQCKYLCKGKQENKHFCLEAVLVIKSKISREQGSAIILFCAPMMQQSITEGVLHFGNNFMHEVEDIVQKGFYFR